jgi:hypothetical protein
MPSKPFDLRSPRPVPVEYSGKWVAWNSDHSQIVDHSDSIQDLWQIVLDCAVVEPVFEKVPRSDAQFIGMR